MESKKINQLATNVNPQTSDLTTIGDPITGQLKKITWLQVAHLIGAQASVTLQQVTDNGNETTDPITTGGLTLTNIGTGVVRSTNGEVVGTYGYGLANGVATLDSGGKIPAAQLPSSVMEYKGTWNASTNTPTLADGTGDNGDVYLVNVAGSQDLGSGTISFAVGDWVVYNGTIWQKSLNSNAVASVFGRTGTITAQEGDYNIDQLGDVAITSAAANDYLRYTGSSWVNTPFPSLLSSDKLVLAVRNNSGATINKGTVVYINGATAGYPTIAKALATGDSTSAQTMGVVQDNISNNANGYVVAFGQITGIDTSAYTAGTQLYLSSTTAGAFTSTKQYAPNHLVYVGVVTTQNAVNGVIEVRVQNGYELDEIHDVSAQNPSNNDGIFYNTTTSLWEKKSIATVLGYTPEQPLTFSAPLSRSTNTVSIPVATSSANGYLSSTDWTTFNNKLTSPMTTLGDIIYGGASGAATRLAGNTTTTKQYLSQTGTGTVSAAPAWATIAGSDITGAALTKTDDTNVTLTLGGTPTTALLRAASLTLGWTGQLAISRGGTGLSALGTAGQLLRVNSGATSLEYFTPTYISAAITSLNGLTAATQTFATGTTGTDFNISSTTATHTFNIPDASTTARGLVTTGTQTFIGTKIFTGSTDPRTQFITTSNDTVGIYLASKSSGTTVGNATLRINNVGTFQVYNGTSTDQLNMHLTTDGNLTAIGFVKGASLYGNNLTSSRLPRITTSGQLVDSTIWTDNVSYSIGQTAAGSAILTLNQAFASIASPTVLRLQLDNSVAQMRVRAFNTNYAHADFGVYGSGGIDEGYAFIKFPYSDNTTNVRLKLFHTGHSEFSGNVTLANGGDLILTPATSGVNATLYNDIGVLVSTASISVQGTGEFSSAVAGYGMSVTNVQDSAQGLLLRASDNDTTLYVARFQSSVGATSQTWVDRFSIAKNGSTVIGDNAPFVNVRLAVKGEDQTASNYALDVMDSLNQSIAWFRNDKTARFYGNVGIGVSPTQLLDVAGNIRIGVQLDSTTRYIGKASDAGTWRNAVIFASSSTEDYIAFNTHLSGTRSGEFMRMTGSGAMQIFRINQNLSFADTSGGIYMRQNGSVSGTIDELRISARAISLTSHSGTRYLSFADGGTATFTSSVLANSPSEGATGEGLIAGRSFKIDATGSGQSAKMYVVSNTLSDTYGSGLTIQAAKFTNDAGFGFNLSTGGTFETYVKQGSGSWLKSFTITKDGYVNSPRQPSWSVGRSTAQNFTSGTTGTINWDQSSGNECFTQGGVTLNGSNGRITVPVAGRYVIFASIRTEGIGAATGTNLNLRKNGSTILRFYVGDQLNSAGSFMYIEPRPIIVECAANDYIDFQFDSITNNFSISAVTNTVVRFGGFLTN